VVLLEGMAMPKPIVVTDVDGISAVLVDRKTGLFVPLESHDKLA